ncbi:MAG TPA: ATP-dependent helicase [Gemmatimonadales bacterium]|nr:ATP-dependent helicase [Gemmatimonadales bacterium]
MSDDPRIHRLRPRTEITPDSSDPAAELNEEQRAAATHGDGPLLIVAGAGTGKTRTLVVRVWHLLQQGVPPERILLLTFTRRAAQEMLARVERLAGPAGRRVRGGTFHATAHSLLRRFGAQAGLPSDFTILDQGDSEDLMGLSRTELGFAEKKKKFPRKETLQRVYSRHVNTERSVNDILDEELPVFSEHAESFTRIFADYVERKASRNLVDYDDLLLYWATMLDAVPALAERIASLYDHILVDEYQDTNVLQARILRGMCRKHSNVTVVGDDAQSIYSFRGAEVRNILDFPKQFPGTRIVTLEQNYRSSQQILDTGNTLISRAPERYTKALWTTRTDGERPWLVTAQDEQRQTAFVVDRILELHESSGIPLSEIAVLFRAGYMSADLEIELTNRRIPFEKWGGLKFLEAAHVKDVLAFVRVLENPRDEVSWFRLLLLLPGVGDVTARSAVNELAAGGWELGALSNWRPPPRAREAFRELLELFNTIQARPSGGEGSVAADIARVRQVYDPILRERFDNADPRLADLEQLQAIAGGYPDRAAFLAAIALEPPQSTQDLAESSDGGEDDSLVLSTTHSAKGREWDAVFLIWAVDGWFPMARASGKPEELDEERRLMYVALTRARHHLHVVYPLHVYQTRRGADYSIDQLSRFLDRGVRDTMQRIVVESEGEDDAVPDDEAPAPVVDIRSILRGRFN